MYKPACLAMAALAAIILAVTFGSQPSSEKRKPAIATGSKASQDAGKRLSEATNESSAGKTLAASISKRNEAAQSPAAKRQRTSSRSRYRSLGAAQALEAVADQQATVLERPMWAPPKLQKGEKLVAFSSERSARIDMPSSERDAIVSSTVEPIATVDSEGKLAAIDTALVADGDRFRATRTKTGAEFPLTLSDGAIVAKDAKGEVRLKLGESSSKATVTGDSAKLFYANSQTDTDTILEALPRGAAVSWTLRSPLSPESLKMEFEGDAGNFELFADGAIGFEAGKLGRGEISPPVAYDAQGTKIDARYEIDGDDVIVKVPHSASDIAYPIVVDPLVSIGGVTGIRDDLGWTGSNYRPLSNGSVTPFSFETNNTVNMLYTNPAEGSGNRMKVTVRSGARGSNWANIRYDAPNASTIFRVHWTMSNHIANYYSEARFGIVSPAHAWEGQANGWQGNGCANICWGGPGFMGNNVGMPEVEVHNCAASNCGMGGSGNNTALLQFVYDLPSSAASNTFGTYVSTRGAYVYYSDYNAPSMSISGLGTSAWTNRAASTVTASINDNNGVGLGNSNIADSNGQPYVAKSAFNFSMDGVTQLGTGVGPFCTGGITSPCPTTQSPSVTTFGVGREGIRNFRFEAADIVGQTTPHEVQLKTDNSGPDVDIAGRLGTFALEDSVLGGKDPRTVVKNTPFLIRAFDGRRKDAVTGNAAPASDRRSGVQSIEATVFGSNTDGTINLNDTRLGPYSNQSLASECDTNNHPATAEDSCQLSLSGSFNAESLTPGIYHFKVTSKDWINQETSKTFKVAVGIASLERVSEGRATSRYVPLRVNKGASSAASTVLQYRVALNSPWCKVASSAIRPETDFVGSTPDPVPFVSSKTDTVVVDLDALRLKQPSGSCNTDSSNRLPDGKVYLRARLDGAGADAINSSEDVVVRYERGGLGTENETTELSPGTVDLVSGNFSMSSTDVSIDAYKADLTVSRTYNSRYVDGVTKIGAFGPGWKFGVESEAAGAVYSQIVDYANVDLPEEERYAAVELTTTDGNFMTFELIDNSNEYKSEPGLEMLQLNRIPDEGDSSRTAGFKLVDKESGTVTSFMTRPSGAPSHHYAPTDSVAPGSSDAVTYSYGLSGTIGTYPTFAFAPSAGIDCRDSGETAGEAYSTLPRGCSALEFNYSAPASGRRLDSVDLKTWDPENGSMREETVAHYTYDASRRLVESWDPRISPALKTTYTYVSGTDHRVATITPPGEQPFTLAYNKLAEDSNHGRIKSVSRPTLLAAPNNVATWEARYYVPVHGANAPFDFSLGEVSKWGQENPAFTAAAIFPPDQPPNGDPATNYDRASISYLDPFGKEVNSRAPGGRISTIEYDDLGNAIRSLTPENRARAIEEPTPAERIEAAERWDTKTFYDDVPSSPEGRKHVVRTIGPEHEVQLENGSIVQARQQTTFCHDENRSVTEIESDTFSATCRNDKLPVDTDSGEPFDLVTSSRVGALVGSDPDGSGGSVHDVRTNATHYGETQSELKLRLARLTVTDPGSGRSNVKRKIEYNADGLESARYQPNSQSTSAPTTTKTHYYEKDATSDCPAKPEWRGLPCKVEQGGQPSTTGLPKLPSKTFTYNYLRQPLVTSESVVDASGTMQTRTTTLSYDAAGRVSSENVSGSVGQPVKKSKHVYSATTGREIETQSLNSDGSVHESITRAYDSLGRQTTYTDAEGHGSGVTEFDILSRPKITGDGKATRTNTFDPVTGELTGMNDSGLSGFGTFSASYDDNGQLITEALPGGLTKAYTYDTVGNATQLTYTRTSGCSTGCVWVTNTAAYNIHGQMVGQGGLPTQAGAATSQHYDYDELGRLIETRDTSAGQCTIRQYVLDNNSNRTNMKTIAPGGGGACNPSGSPSNRNRSYDSADRITHTGYVYDAFGRITTTPNVDAGGSGNLSATYFVNDLAHSVSQDGVTQTIDLDPNYRMNVKVKSGLSTGTETYAYTDDSDSPAWIQNGSAWTRYVEGIDGTVAAIHPSSGSARWTVSDIRGDTIAEATASGLQNVREIDEFGVVKNNLPTSRPYGFHGSKQREALTSFGTVAMGVRLYAPRSGRFLQVDPVLGGTESPYEYPSDPVNSADLNGKECFSAYGSFRYRGIGAWAKGSWCSSGSKVDSDGFSASSGCRIDAAGSFTGVTQCKGPENISMGLKANRKRLVYESTVVVGDQCAAFVGCGRNVRIHVKATFRANGTYRIHFIDTRYKRGDKRRNRYRNGTAKCTSGCSPKRKVP